MQCHATVSILVLSALIGAAVQVTAVPASQGTDALRRDFYGPEVLEAFLIDHGRQPSETTNEAAVSSEGARLVGPAKSRYSADAEANDRFLRTLDQLGGGNLLRRETPKWNRGNLDQIGGGNLLRELPREQGSDRGERNLDQIGGGNLIRSLNDLRRNLDQIGGGNLVRSFDARAPHDQQLLDDQQRRIRPWSSQIRPGSTVFSVDDTNELSPIRSTRLLPSDRALFDQFAKRNIDEIDRTAFDNFFKRNLGEIDRVGWNAFVKKFSDHLANGRTGILERRG